MLSLLFGGKSHRVLLTLEPERAHELTIQSMRGGFGPRSTVGVDPALTMEVFGLTFPNPVGIAAGFDKNAEVVDSLLRMGFGFVEVGSVTPKPQPGNPKPRVFRLAEDRGIVNRLGFNSEGIAKVEPRLARRRKARGGGGAGPVGVNLGANKDAADPVEDYRTGFRRLAPFADYVTINVSSPNTPGLRDLQGEEALHRLLSAIDDMRREMGASAPPVLLKVAPDLSHEEIETIASVVTEHDVAGLVVSNTTVARPEGLTGAAAKETGGLSGRPLYEQSTIVLARFAKLLWGKMPLVGVGGVESGETAFGKITAGASLVQSYTGLVYGGPGFVDTVRRELADHLAVRGFSHLKEAVGTERDRWAQKPLLAELAPA